ncbi:GMC oxidoreductase [Streptomyces sp. TRM76323]|uniref:GMC oxidoreductase n=1 Tax=Streptomyces tamarix TaxID=3078565 RepID=A0ABU3QKG5_9ACTN|nr:GMC oxidoreductase [Streptomyces tamarix]MDT9683253.1 GMC oxidoreductase [Streptomyces tamarix]
MPEHQQKSIHVAGERRGAASGATREVLDPADATVLAVVAGGGGADAETAAAGGAFDRGRGPWPATPAVVRAVRVRGLDGLRVADASVFPTMTAVNPMVAVLMVGEKAAELLGGDAR